MHHNRVYNVVVKHALKKHEFNEALWADILSSLSFHPNISQYIVHLQNLIGTRAMSISVYLITQIDFNQNIPSIGQLYIIYRLYRT